MMRAAAQVAFALAAIAAAQPTAPTPDFDPAVRDVLTLGLKFSASDLNEMRRGRVVKHNLDAHAAGEFGVAGGIRVSATKDAFLAAARDIVKFKASAEVLQIGRFSSPASIDDL